MIIKCDAEPARRAVREALAKYHGGRVIPEGPPKGESQPKGVVEEAGKTVRDFTRVYKDQIEEKAGIIIEADVVIRLDGKMGSHGVLQIFGWSGRTHSI